MYRVFHSDNGLLVPPVYALGSVALSARTALVQWLFSRVTLGLLSIAKGTAFHTEWFCEPVGSYSRLLHS